ncbi:MAG: hypothetical protein WA364_28175 [Candidatus Nitrosopolaris sp.]
MELKRKYREEEVNSGEEEERSTIIKENNWFRKNLSLTGLFYHFSRYGESKGRPTLIGVIILALSPLFWLFQNNSTAKPSLSLIANVKPHMAKPAHNFINVTQILNNTHTVKAFERSLGDFSSYTFSSKRYQSQHN